MLKKPSPLKHKEEGHMIMTEEAHKEAHAEDVEGTDTIFGIEIDDFKPKKEEEKKKVDESNTFRLLTEKEEEEFYPSTQTVIAKGIDGEDVEIEQPISFEQPESKMTIDRRESHWKDDEISNYKRKND